MERFLIYIVDDDAAISSLIKENIGKWGFDAVCCRDFAAVRTEFESIKPQLVLMDISLPFYNGFYWCGEIRKSSSVPVIFLSSHNESMDIVMAVNMGGDDYLTKPFSMDVLTAKINAVLRRAYSYTVSAPELCARGAVLCAGAGVLQVGENAIELTKNELKIMSTLLERKNSIVTRECIMKALWDSDSFVDDNTLTVNINRLRTKLAEAGLKELIVTKKGMGYAIYD